MIEYLAKFLPNVSVYTSILSGMCSNNHPFMWRPIHKKSFNEIKHIVRKASFLRPIDWDSPNRDPVWIISDACPSGVGAMIAQGPTWQTARPASFMSKKFTDVQQNYFTYEHETLGFLEALLKWEDRLLGREFTIVTDHKALTWFQQTNHKGSR